MLVDEIKDIIDEAELKMDDTLAYLKNEFAHIRAGKASPSLIDTLQVDYYGSQTPLRQLANITAPEPRMLVVQPYDKTTMQDIEKAIMASGLGLNPSNDGVLIRVPLPILTEERRKDLVKITRDKAEKARISIRNARREANDAIKKTVEANSLPEDSRFEGEEKVQTLTDTYIKKTDELLAAKESDIMTV